MQSHSSRKGLQTQYNVYDVSKKKQLTITLSKKLGAGSFGEAFLAKSLDYDEPLVCKIIDLQGQNAYIQYSPHQLLRFTYREIRYLQRLGMLIGYQHDKDHQKILIVMKRLPGIAEYNVAPKLRRLAEYASFSALRKLHRQGVAHMDPHECNFLYENSKEQAFTIDFGAAQDSHFFRELRDYYLFLKLRRTSPTLFSSEGRATLGYFIDFYCHELKEHILANQVETAKTLFCYASVIIAALCGASTLGIASILAQALLKAMILPALSELLETVQDHYELRAFNQRQAAAIRYFSYVVVGTMMVLQGLILALQVLTLGQHASQLFSGITQFGEVCANSQTFWQSCAQTFPLEEAITTLIQLKPWVHICQYWHHNAEKYLFTENAIISCYQHQIATDTNPPSFLPHFAQKTTLCLSVKSKCIASRDCIESRPSP